MRLIDADELLAQMIGMNDGWFDPRPAYDYESLIKIQPIVDAVPVKHGRWINENDDPLTIPCSMCGYQVFRYNNTPYCPNCGAKMDLEE